MEPLFYWRKQWDRVLIRPDDLRAIDHRLSASIGQAHGEQQVWKTFPWQDRFQAAGAGSVDAQVVELRARHKTMLALNMLIARFPGGVNMKEVMDAPRKSPIPPGRQSEWEGDAVPKAVELNLEKPHLTGKHPGAMLEVWASGRLSGGAIVSSVTPHIEKTVRRAPQPEPVGIAAALFACAVPDLLLAVDLISPALALLLVFVLGAGSYFGALRAMEWLFPPLELLPDEHTNSRWQKTWGVIRGASAALVGVLGIAAFVLALGQ